MFGENNCRECYGWRRLGLCLIRVSFSYFLNFKPKTTKTLNLFFNESQAFQLGDDIQAMIINVRSTYVLF